MAAEVIGYLNLPAVPLNLVLAQAMMPNSTKVAAVINKMLQS
jgi:2-oxoisovalerate dehydrogenase E1 component